MLWKRLGLTVVLVHGNAPPTDAEWAEYLRVYQDANLLQRGCSIVFTEGGAPTADQRRSLQRYTEKAPFPTAVLTSHALVRIVISGVSWFNPGIRAFGPADIAPALLFLKSVATEASVRAARDELTAKLTH
jgi:hypothetical protein